MRIKSWASSDLHSKWHITVYVIEILKIIRTTVNRHDKPKKHWAKIISTARVSRTNVLSFIHIRKFMLTVRHKEAACVNISRDFMCLSPGKLIPRPRLCQCFLSSFRLRNTRGMACRHPRLLFFEIFFVDFILTYTGCKRNVEFYLNTNSFFYNHLHPFKSATNLVALRNSKKQAGAQQAQIAVSDKKIQNGRPLPC